MELIMFFVNCFQYFVGFCVIGLMALVVALFIFN